jgi:hypothetical protein
MSDGDGPGGELPSEFESALKKLKALFAGALGDAKLESCCAAWSDIKVAKSRKKKIEILDERTRQWREGSVDAIREWFPRFVELAAAYDEVLHGEALQWATDRVWELVEKQCGIRRRKHDEPHRVESISRTMVFWFAVASEGDSDVNGPPPRPWRAPRWFARDGKETGSLLREQTHDLWLRLNQVVNEEQDRAEIQRAISRSDLVALAKQKHDELGTSLSKHQSSATRPQDSAAGGTGSATALTNEQVTGKRRADLVGKLIVELNALRPLMQVPEDDYPLLCRQNPEYEVFKICAKHPSASQWVKFLPDRRRVEGLAFELAAAALGVKSPTIQTAWKHYKPKAPLAGC